MNLTIYSAKLTLKVLQRIRQRGPDNPIKCKTLADEFSVNMRVITAIVETSRDAGEWICAAQKPPYGYYYAQSKHQLAQHIEKEHQRCMQQLARHKKQLDYTPQDPSLFDQEAA